MRETDAEVRTEWHAIEEGAPIDDGLRDPVTADAAGAAGEGATPPRPPAGRRAPGLASLPPAAFPLGARVVVMRPDAGDHERFFVFGCGYSAGAFLRTRAPEDRSSAPRRDRRRRRALSACCGLAALPVRRARARRGHRRGARPDHPSRRVDRPRRGRRSRPSTSWRGPTPPCAVAALDRLPLDGRGVFGDHGGAWVDETTAPGADVETLARAAGGRTGLGGRWRTIWIVVAPPPAAFGHLRPRPEPRSTSCVPARRVGSSSRVRSSTASTSTTSRAPSPIWPQAARRHRQRHRRRTGASPGCRGPRRRHRRNTPAPGDRFRHRRPHADGTIVLRREQARVANTALKRAGYALRFPTFREGLTDCLKRQNAPSPHGIFG